MSTQPPQRPEIEYRAVGNGVIITAAVWRNETVRDGRTIASYSIRPHKRYYSRDLQAWQDSETYFPEDLPKLRLVIDRAYEYVTLQERDPNAPRDLDPAEQVVA